MIKCFTATVALPLLLIALPTGADEKSASYGPWVWGVNAGAVQQLDASVDDGDGDFSVIRGFVSGSLSYAWDRRTSVGLSIGGGRSDYDFDRGVTIDGRSPWGDIEDYRVSLPVRFAPMEKANVILIPSVRSYTEEGASFADGRTEGLIAGAGWQFSDTLTLGPGFGWYTELDGGSSAFPILVVDWQITEKLALETGRGLAASQGPGLTLSYTLNDNWSVAGAARYEKVRFALDDDAGIGEDRSTPLIMSLNYSPWPMTSASLIAGVELAGQLSLEDNSGRTIASSDYGSAPVFGVSFTTRF
jgi:long-subunit fatty acid transport protein